MDRGQRITLQEAAALLDVHYMTAYRYVRTGRLPARQEGMRWTVAVSDLEVLSVVVAARRARPGLPTRPSSWTG
jgi:excisionase family DNA binding protein